jgi:hypothetical protein
MAPAATFEEQMLALLDVVRTARSLTQLAVRGDGAIVIGPVGWEQLQRALRKLTAEG